MASRRPFSGRGLYSHVFYALCRTEESRADRCTGQGSADGPRGAPRPRLLNELRRKRWRNATGVNSDTATVATAGTANVGVAANMVGVATTTAAAGVTGGGGAPGAGLAKGAAETATLSKQPGQLAAALAEATEGGETAVWLRAPPRGRLWSNIQGRGRSSGEGKGGRRNNARGRSAWGGSTTSSRSSSSLSLEHSGIAVVAGKRCQELWQEEHLGLRLSPSRFVC